MSKPCVFMAMPHYGGSVQMESAKAFLCHACDTDRVDTLHYDYGRSLLANTFNHLWCAALNSRRKHPITHFAMLHNDVAPLMLRDDEPVFWLEILLAELAATDADLCAACVPIKSSDGLTSTAIAGDSEFDVLRRLTINEVRQLPATFDAEACGYQGRALLANTGCWVCRFDRPWVEHVKFEIRDKIFKDPETGTYDAAVLPEDWNFSRQIHDFGGKVVCTRKVPIRHFGGSWFNMDRKNGLAVDHSAKGAPLPVFAKIKFPDDVDGWLTGEEGEALARLATGKRVLEIGSYCGRSTICLAQTAESVVSIDPHDGRGTPSPRPTREEFEANLERYGVADRVLSVDNPPAPALYDLIFIDGAHDAEAVREDVATARRLLAPGGLVAFHDYRLYPNEAVDGWDPGVTQVVNELRANGAEVISRHHTLCVVRLPSLARSLAS